MPATRKRTQHAPFTKTECDYLYGWTKRQSRTQKNLTQNGESQRHSWERRRRRRPHNTRHIIIIIAFKGTIWDFLQSLLRELSPTRTLKWPGHNRVHITCNTFSAYHVQHIVIPATWYEGTAKLLSLTELKSHLFDLHIIGWTISRWRRGGNRSTRRKPLATSFRKCHILQPEDSRPKWDSNPHNSIGGRIGKQTY